MCSVFMGNILTLINFCCCNQCPAVCFVSMDIYSATCRLFLYWYHIVMIFLVAEMFSDWFSTCSGGDEFTNWAFPGVGMNYTWFKKSNLIKSRWNFTKSAPWTIADIEHMLPQNMHRHTHKCTTHTHMHTQTHIIHIHKHTHTHTHSISL